MDGRKETDMTKDEAIKFYDKYIEEHPELTQQKIAYIRQIQEAIRNKKEN